MNSPLFMLIQLWNKIVNLFLLYNLRPVYKELNVFQDQFGFKVRKSKISPNMWKVYAQDFSEAYMFFLRASKSKQTKCSHFADFFKYTCDIGLSKSLLLTDKVSRDSSEVARIYLIKKKKNKAVVIFQKQ